MSSSPFSASQAKLRNAKRHIETTVKLIAEYQKNNPMRWNNVAAVGSGEKAIRFEVSAELPEDVILSAGDAIHNLRSCLDIAAVDAVRLSGGNTNNVYFPFADQEDNLETAIKKKNFHRAEQSFSKVVRSLKPFKGGNKMLRGIHDLDIMDKHIVLIATSHMAQIPFLKVGGLTIIRGTVGRNWSCLLYTSPSPRDRG